MQKRRYDVRRKDKVLRVRIENDNLDKLKNLSDMTNCSMSSLIRCACSYLIYNNVSKLKL